MRSFQRQFRAMHGTVASDTALRSTMEASNSRRSVKPDHIASLLSNLDVMTTCYGRLLLNGSHVKSDGLVLQFDIHERIEGACRNPHRSTE